MVRRFAQQDTVKRIWEPGSNLYEYRQRLVALMEYASKQGVKVGSIAAATGIDAGTIRYGLDGTAPVRVPLLRAIELALGLRPTVVAYKAEMKKPPPPDAEARRKLKLKVDRLQSELKKAREPLKAERAAERAEQAELKRLQDRVKYLENLVAGLRCKIDVDREARKRARRRGEAVPHVSHSRSVLDPELRSKKRLEATMAWASLGNPNPPTEPPPPEPKPKASQVRKDRLRLLQRWWLESTGQVRPPSRYLESHSPVLGQD